MRCPVLILDFRVFNTQLLLSSFVLVETCARFTRFTLVFAIRAALKFCPIDGTETIGNFYMQQFNDARSNLSETK